MDDKKKSGYMTAEERRAFGWLWQGYLRKFMPSIALVFVLILAHSAALVSFLGLIQGSFSQLFDPNNGTFTFVDEAKRSHERGIWLDSNEDGVYEFEIEIKSNDKLAGNWVTVAIALPNTAADLTETESEFVVQSDGDIALSTDQIASLVGTESLGSIAGDDSLFVRFDRGGTGALLIGLLFILFAATLIRVSTSYISGRLAARITALASLEIRRDLVRRLFSLDLVYFDTAQSGKIILALTTLVERVQSFFSTSLLNAGKASGTIIGILAYLAWVHWGLFLFIALVFPIAFFGIRAVTDRMRSYSGTGLAAQASFLTNLETSVGGIRTIKLTNQTETAQEGLISDARNMSRIQLRLARYHTLIAPMVDLLAAFAVMGIVGLGGMAVVYGWAGLSAATLVTFVIGLALIFSPAARLSGFNVTFTLTLVALRSLYAMSREEPKIVDKKDATETFDATGSIDLHNLTFAYGEDRESLLFDKLNLTFEGGKTSAIVGQTGSGKTTILSLVARLYEPLEGEIRIGGTDIADIKISALRQVFSVVTQDVFLFDGTIHDNIRFVAPNATDQEIEQAAAKAQLTDLINEKRQVTVGPRGAKLSGGQKQRIAIARAFLQDAPIVLLDEATSALDQRTEEKITRALKDLCRGKTTLIIAHRLTTITHADEIFVLEKGAVAEQGTHAKLMKDGGLYSVLYRAQQNPQSGDQ